jgi:hypothetical protein
VQVVEPQFIFLTKKQQTADFHYNRRRVFTGYNNDIELMLKKIKHASHVYRTMLPIKQQQTTLNQDTSRWLEDSSYGHQPCILPAPCLVQDPIDHLVSSGTL